MTNIMSQQQGIYCYALGQYSLGHDSTHGDKGAAFVQNLVGLWLPAQVRAQPLHYQLTKLVRGAGQRGAAPA